MPRKSFQPSHPALIVRSVTRVRNQWEIEADSRSTPRCPACQVVSAVRHSWYRRTLRDLPVQGVPAVIRLRTGRWRCLTSACERVIFTERLPGLASPHARRTSAVAEIMLMLGHGAGGETSRRLLGRLGIPVSGDTVLRQLKDRPIGPPAGPALRVVGVDDWAWRKGSTYGTIFVDLERRTVVDVLADRSQASVADWLSNHPGIEVVCRDRHCLYAEGARAGSPNARQIADRFHLIQNLRSRIEHDLGGRHHRPVDAADPKLSGADRNNLDHAGRRKMGAEQFARVHELCREGWSAMDIARHLGMTRRRVDEWMRCETLPERAPVDPKTTSPARFEAALRRLVRQGVTKIRWLFEEAKKIGYTGSFGHMARSMAHIRSLARAREQPVVEPRSLRALPRDPTSGARISPLTAAAICMKPRPMLTERQSVMLEVLKDAVPGFITLRRLAMQFRGLLCGKDVGKLEAWIMDAQNCGIPAVIYFARTLRQDIDAVRNAVAEPWSNGPTEGQINRLKILRRSTFGRAGVRLLRARLMPYPGL